MDLKGDCSLCENNVEDIIHLFVQYPVVKEVWSRIAGFCLISNK